MATAGVERGRSRSRGRCIETAESHQTGADGDTRGGGAPDAEAAECCDREGGDGVGVPVIDIAGLWSSDLGERRAVATQIGRACEGIGFFVVVNHRIPKEVVEDAWRTSSEFFDLPLGEKMRFASEDVAVYPYGYVALGGEALSRGKQVDGGAEQDAPSAAGDLKEMFSLGPKGPAGAETPQRRLPARPAGFAAAWEAYYEHVDALARRLLCAFALALELPERWFDSVVDRHASSLRGVNYPDQSGLRLPGGAIRCSAHTDYGTLTILKSGGPGLQLSKDNVDVVWHDVPFIEDAFVVNLGDLMRRWTNDRWSSTLHRVVNPPAGEAGLWGRRLALAYFHNLNPDASVEPIPSCISAGHPALYDPIVAGDFLRLKHWASIGKADPDAHLKSRRGTR